MTNVDGLAKVVEYGVNGHQLDMSQSYAQVKDNAGNLIGLSVAGGTHANSVVTYSQLATATGVDKGTVWLDYSTEPEASNFAANSAKLIDLTAGVAALDSSRSAVPASTTWDNSDERTYAVDIVNGLITPNPVDKQAHVISVELEYGDWGSGTNTGVGGYLSLVEYDGTAEQLEIRKQFRKANNDSGTGVVTLDFHTNCSTHVNGAGKGWRLYVTSLEGDSNAKARIKSLRVQSL